jgi:hypothetical protein
MRVAGSAMVVAGVVMVVTGVIMAGLTGLTVWSSVVVHVHLDTRVDDLIRAIVATLANLDP